ncbi:TetR family transcriptional regulator [Brevibacterium sanguinis]|uniref:TetR family transcriptional regulator n=2 Tax=Brevibacterium TaxID=1696 RepID=A0A366IJA0_9MICO|nr:MULTISPECIES: TetR family transcriptional regulator [Brevibacterium]RBP64956.1 TetR family transcriptional regulator [Brevibacterium sanguinis]RBP71219.1 TetR family transcriptional regulator [Brevibacterium celere]
MTPTKREQKRQDLLRATSQVIGEHGFSGVSVRAVAARAQVSVGSVLYHFDSFDALLETAIRGAIDEFIDRRRQLAEQHADPTSRLRATIDAGIPETISDDLRVVYEASAILRERPHLRTHITVLLERQVALYSTIIQVGTALGEFRPRMDVEAIAQNLVALEDAYDLYLLDPDNWQRERYFANTLAFAEVALDVSLTPDAKDAAHD